MDVVRGVETRSRKLDRVGFDFRSRGCAPGARTESVADSRADPRADATPNARASPGSAGPACGHASIGRRRGDLWHR